MKSLKTAAEAGGIRVLEPITVGTQNLRTVMMHDRMILTGGTLGTITVLGDPKVLEEFSIGGALNGLLGGVGDALVALKKVLSCTPVTTTTVTTKPNGVIDKIETTTTCVPG
jgi:hypothetical protein